MKFPNQTFAILTSSLSLFTVNLAVSSPAQASIVCESGTISNYSNGSLANCILGQNMTVQVYNPSSGSSNFYCQAKEYISFDEKAQFQSCRLSQDTQIRNGNSIETCPAEYRVYFSVSNDGIQSISCSL
ncbi:hypothetical protein [Halotia branconii]|uniref:Secreted protein n=1 Tax=Halotia branconii CENA392 TaxID=1539056 RepID=A0AAJ6NVL3_9CYAN|nr:hypothetical protein [Halotia branconii]WGV27323.1 hypothetical protein QI031_07485 [Halotia branconii CENA392]